METNDKNLKNGKAVAGFVCGIISLASLIIPYLSLACLPLAIVGLVLSIRAGKKCKETNQKSGLATAGLVMSIVSLSILVVMALILYPFVFLAFAIAE